MKTGIVIEHRGHEFIVELENGKYEIFFSDFPNSWNKSVKKGDRVKVYFKHSILAGYVSYRVTRILK
jgi:hypothetical protein